MDELFRGKYKRYLATRRATDLTKYAKNELKKLKECDGITTNIKSVETKDTGSTTNFESMDLQYEETSNQDIYTQNMNEGSYSTSDECFTNVCNDTAVDRIVENQKNNLVEQTISEHLTDNTNFPYEFFDSENDEDESPDIRNVKSLKDLLNSTYFSKKISTPVAISPIELLLMILKLCKSLYLHFDGMSKLITLINNIFEKPILPQSKYKLDQIFNEKNDLEFHAICPMCTGYLGKSEDLGAEAICTICQKSVPISSTMCENLFVIINPSIAIAELLEAHEHYYDYVMNERQCDSNYMTDIYDGIKYREFVNSLPSEDKRRYVTTIMNTDGASPFKTAPSSLYPIFLILNEIPLQDRMDNPIPCGLWFNRKKPNMMVFLDPFVDMMNNKVSNGIKCTIKGEERKIKGYTLLSCVDTVARAPIQGIKQFNGKFGCNWCLHPGKWSSGSMRYPVFGEGAPDDIVERDHKSTIFWMEKSVEDNYKPVYGIKHPSAFMRLMGYDMIDGFVSDYMHTALGAGKQITNLLLNNEDTDFIQPLLQSIKCPNQISRLTRPLSESKYWKCREWEIWILYTSTPLLSSILSPTYLQYWTLFVASLYILLQTKISLADIDKADEMLYEFVFKTQEYFGITAMTSNIHALLHLARSVLHWGQLWAHSCFAFEAGNHYMLQAIHCARGVNSQIIRYINLNRCTSILENYVFPDASEAVKVYLNNTLKSRIKKSTKISTITYFGKAFPLEPKINENFQLPSASKYFKRMVKDNCLYSSCLKVNQRSDNSFAQLHDGRFVKIEKFVVDFDNNNEYTLCYNVGTAPHNLSTNYEALHRVVKIEESICCIKTEDIKIICIFMEMLNASYICPIPNLLYY